MNELQMNELQQGKVNAILSELPEGWTLRGQSEDLGNIYVDVATPAGIDFRFTITSKGRVSRHRKMQMS